MADTPMYSQYLNLKDKYPDCILLFRLGDFYEAFDDDAKTISKVLGITLTGRGKVIIEFQWLVSRIMLLSSIFQN